jgi:hypothetical protein
MNDSIAMQFFFDTTPDFIKEMKDEIEIYNAMIPYRSSYGNQTTHRIKTEQASKRIEMIFDWSNPVMALFRRIAANLYWVMIGLIVSQVLLLNWRGIGLQPVWVFIEYL